MGRSIQASLPRNIKVLEERPLDGDDKLVLMVLANKSVRLEVWQRTRRRSSLPWNRWVAGGMKADDGGLAVSSYLNEAIEHYRSRISDMVEDLNPAALVAAVSFN